MEEHPGHATAPSRGAGGFGGGQTPSAGGPPPAARRPESARPFGMTNKLAGMVGVLLIVLIIGGLAIAKVGPFATRTVWSAVFMGDNEVFFGHLKDVSSTEIDLVNVYYLQKSTPAATGTNT